MNTTTVTFADLVPVDVIGAQYHPVSQESPYTSINMSWQYTGTENIEGYYYKVSTSPYTITYNETNDDETDNTSAKVEKTDGTYYLYIAPYMINPGNPPSIMPSVVEGPVTEYGPLIVDTKAPENVSIGPENHTTDTNKVELTIGADEQIAMINISEGNYGGGTWENVSGNTHPYELKQGEKNYTLRIQVMDKAGKYEYDEISKGVLNDRVTQHIAFADPFEITYTTADNLIMAKYTSVPTLSQWGMLLFLTILISIGIYTTRRTVFAAKV